MADKKTPKQQILARAKELADAHNYESPLEYNRALRYYLNEVANVRSPYAIPATGEQTEDVQVPDSMLKRDGYGNPPRGDNENNVASHKEMGDKSFSDNVSSTLKAGIEGGRKMLAPIYHSVRDAVDVYSGKAALDEIEKGNKLLKEVLFEGQGKMLSEDLKNRVTEAIKGRYNQNQNLQDLISKKKSTYEDIHKRAGEIKDESEKSHQEFQKNHDEFVKSQEDYKKQLEIRKQKESSDLVDSEARAKSKVESEYSGKNPDEVLAHYAKKYNRPDYKPASAKEEQQSSLPTPAKEMSPYSIEAYNARKQASMNANPIRK